MTSNSFVIIVPVYNSEKWIGKCIDSILMQDYNNYKLIVIDDCSTDGTWGIIKNYGVDCLRNSEHSGSALANIIQGIKFFAFHDEDIIVTIDGDDWLADNGALLYLNEVYKNDIWLTYGQYKPLSGKYKYTCQDLSSIRTPGANGKLITVSVTPDNYRQSELWVTSHLRTFKHWLWNMIDDNDLRDIDGGYFKVAWDLAFMYPMIEMAGAKHIKFIDKLLYIYNDLNPNCDGKINTESQLKTAEYIQNKPKYNVL